VTRLLISTSCRHTAPDQPSGHLFVFDLEKKDLLRICDIIEPPYRDVDPNPRGGFRGLKGISIAGNQVAIANASTVFVYDRNWKPLAHIWHPSCAGIHDILLSEEKVWVSSSRNDLLICMDFNGRIVTYLDIRRFPIINDFSPRRLRPFLTQGQVMSGRIDFRDPRTHDHAITDSMHVNSLATLGDGTMLISCGLFREVSDYILHKINHALKQTFISGSLPHLHQFYKKLFRKKTDKHFEARSISKGRTNSLLLRVEPTGEVVPELALQECTVPSHSIRILKDRTAIYLNTTTGEIIHFEPESKTVFSTTRVGKRFLRGAEQLPDGNLVMGDNNLLVHFDLAGRQVLSKTMITEDTSEAVFDVKVLPDRFDLPPQSFQQLHAEKQPLRQK
jgi:hypothetical protein